VTQTTTAAAQSPSALDRIDGRSRVVIEEVSPQIDGGAYPVKRVVGDKVIVEADVFADGHDAISAVLTYRYREDAAWEEVPLKPLINDRWTAEFVVERLGEYSYAVTGWIDRFLTWQRDLRKRVAAGQDVALEFTIGADLIREAAAEARGSSRDELVEFERRLRGAGSPTVGLGIAENEALSRLMFRYAPRRYATTTSELRVTVDRPKAGFSAWYEMFPRSAAPEPRHGTFKDVEARLPYVASMGFDVLYLPPIHPIGRSFRKGRNNSTEARPEDPGSPWGIGSEEGGHTAIHPQLGTMEAFRRLRAAADHHGIELAMDIAFQTSPDHPYVGEHPEWFRTRPDGTIQSAENPPKKYQDIYPFDFETEAWESLWHELKRVFDYWLNEGVRIFRVDNPHTKPFPFWEWVIGEIRREHPDAIFLAEAFTRPKIMQRLAKLGFTQSYTYFAWRDTKYEITKYFTELTRSELREYFRPNLWPNTPDILPESLQVGGRPQFMARLVLAATLSGNYGIYGPPFEHGWSAPREHGSEEYLNSEKYEIHQHDLDRPDSLRHFITRVNQVRSATPSIAHAGTLDFHTIDNESLICYSRVAPDLSDVLLVVVNLDPWHIQSGWVDFPIDRLELPSNRPYQMHDLLTDARYLWHGNRNYVELDPGVCPAHMFRLRRRTRSERDFEYFL
jgi:starch synthase (maltosyl-transferring)